MRAILLTFAALLTDVGAQEERDFYQILDIPKNSDEKQIKKAFKKKSLEYHPDKNIGDESALRKFQDVSAAYDMLGDNDKRRKYDRCGEKCANEPDSPGFNDPFGSFFGGGRPQAERTGPSQTIKIRLSLEDLYSGKDMRVPYMRNTICPHCRGSGADDPSDIKTCDKCGGQGVQLVKK